MAIKCMEVNDTPLRSLVVDWVKQAGVSRLVHQMTPEFESLLLQSTFSNQCIDQFFMKTPPGLSTAPYDSSQTYGPFIACESPLLKETLPQSDIRLPPTTQVLPDGLSSPLDVFIRTTWEYAKQAANRLHLDPKVLMAQIALETGWGMRVVSDSHGVSSQNLFNIKALTEQGDRFVNKIAIEYSNHRPSNVPGLFKVYSSIADSFDDYVALITGDHRYQAALALTHDPNQYLHALQKAGFATDPDYATKIWSIYQGQTLQNALVRNECVY